MSNDSTLKRFSPRRIFNRLDATPEKETGHLIQYRDYTNKQLAVFPLSVLAAALVVLVSATVLFGSPVPLGTDFTGGAELTIESAASPSEIEASFGPGLESVTPVRTSNQYVLTFSSTNTQSLTETAQGNGYTVVSAQFISPTFGSETQRLAGFGLLAAFAGMSLLIFAVFRTVVPSVAVVASAFSDLVIPLAMMRLLDIELTLGIVAGLLMLIGYSVDSDVLLNNSVLRRRGDFYESTYGAMRTGVTMTITSIVAMVVMAVSASLFGIDLLAAIGTILVFGLVADLMNTYLMNVSLLRWYKFTGVNR